MALADRTLHKAFWWTPPCPCYAGLRKTPLPVDKLRGRKVFLSFANATDVFHNGEMPIPAGLVHLWFSSTAEFGMAKARSCRRVALYQDLYRRHRILSRASSSISCDRQCITVYCQRMVGLLLWITHCWCRVFLMCNAWALKASVAASNVALKPNLEHLEHNWCTKTC